MKNIIEAQRETEVPDEAEVIALSWIRAMPRQSLRAATAPKRFYRKQYNAAMVITRLATKARKLSILRQFPGLRYAEQDLS